MTVDHVENGIKQPRQHSRGGQFLRFARSCRIIFLTLQHTTTNMDDPKMQACLSLPAQIDCCKAQQDGWQAARGAGQRGGTRPGQYVAYLSHEGFPVFPCNNNRTRCQDVRAGLLPQRPREKEVEHGRPKAAGCQLGRRRTAHMSREVPAWTASIACPEAGSRVVEIWINRKVLYK